MVNIELSDFVTELATKINAELNLTSNYSQI